MSNLVFYASACTDVGRFRKNNEDNFSLLGASLGPQDGAGRHSLRSSVTESGVVAVFDGMGGHSCGERASMMAAEALPAYTGALLTLDPRAVTDYIRAANDGICAVMRSERLSMGSTAAVAAIADGVCTVGNVGDSRIYLFRDGVLTPLTQDHTTAAQLVSMGMLTEAEAARDSRRHQLTQHLGIPAEEISLQPHTAARIALEPSDRLLLCSDGVTDALDDGAIAALLSQSAGGEKLAVSIVDAAIAAGSRDNVTAVVVKVGVRVKPPEPAYEPDAEPLERTVMNPPERMTESPLERTTVDPPPRSSSGRGLKAAIWVVAALIILTWGAIAFVLLR